MSLIQKCKIEALPRLARRWKRGERLLHVPRWLWLAFIGCGLVLALFPQIDLAVSGFFYTAGVGFTARGTWFERLVHGSTYWLLILGVPAMIAIWWVRRRDGYWGLAGGAEPGPASGAGNGSGRQFLTGRDLAYLLLVLALGPGLIVNGLLKEHWGRARPVNCVGFGGTQTFTPAFILSDQGGKSFSSGHAAGSAYWVVVALVLARRHRQCYWLVLAVVYSLLVAWARLAAGGHFFSDILISWFILVLLACGLGRGFYSIPATKLPLQNS